MFKVDFSLHPTMLYECYQTKYGDLKGTQDLLRKAIAFARTHRSQMLERLERQELDINFPRKPSSPLYGSVSAEKSREELLEGICKSVEMTRLLRRLI